MSEDDSQTSDWEDSSDSSDEESECAQAASAAESPRDPPGKAYLLPSLWTGRPATIWFDYPGDDEGCRYEGRESIYELTDPSLRPLYFKSDHTIRCICSTFKQAGFVRLIKGTSSNLFWGHHLKDDKLQALKRYQWVNHFPGSYALGRKDSLWRNISRMARKHSSAYNFCAKSYVLPGDREALERDFVEGEVYIVKPPASAEGRGIRLVNRADGLPRPGQPAIVQQYISEPYLINNRKFDLRIYVGVTSFDPLRAYIYEEGLCRFATSEYIQEHSTRTIRDKFMHLTNYSINKKSDDFVWNKEASKDDEGSKWSLSALWRYLSTQGVDVAALQARIQDIAIKTLISVEHKIVSRMNQVGRPNCFEIFGFDVLLDRDLKPWLIEVNVSCSLASSSPLDKRVKDQLVADTFHMIGIVPSDRKQPPKASLEDKAKARLSKGPGSPLKYRNIFELQAMKLQDITQSDLEIVMEAEDELRRAGHWKRMMPRHDMHKYLQYFEFPRYRNVVLAKWMEAPDWLLIASRLNPSSAPSAAHRAAAAALASAATSTLERRESRPLLSVGDNQTRGNSRPPSSTGVPLPGRRRSSAANSIVPRTPAPASSPLSSQCSSAPAPSAESVDLATKVSSASSVGVADDTQGSCTVEHRVADQNLLYEPSATPALASAGKAGAFCASAFFSKEMRQSLFAREHALTTGGVEREVDLCACAPSSILPCAANDCNGPSKHCSNGAFSSASFSMPVGMASMGGTNACKTAAAEGLASRQQSPQKTEARHPISSPPPPAFLMISNNGPLGSAPANCTAVPSSLFAKALYNGTIDKLVYEGLSSRTRMILRDDKRKNIPSFGMLPPVLDIRP